MLSNNLKCSGPSRDVKEESPEDVEKRMKQGAVPKQKARERRDKPPSNYPHEY